LQEWINNNSFTGWAWSETTSSVTADQLCHSAPLAHLYAYLLANNFLVSMQSTASSTGTTKSCVPS
jgi:hypothetical protein